MITKEKLILKGRLGVGLVPVVGVFILKIRTIVGSYNFPKVKYKKD